MSNKKAILAAMMAGVRTAETEVFTKVSKMADEIGGAIHVSPAASKYGVPEADVRSQRASAPRGPQQPAPYVEEDRYVNEGYVQAQPQTYVNPNQLTNHSPEVLAALMSGDKSAIQQAKRMASAAPQYPVSDSPVAQAMHEAYGNYASIANPAPQVLPQQHYAQPQMLNEEVIRASVQKIIQEELNKILLDNIFSENRMMSLYEQQFKKTLTKLLEQRMAQKKTAPAKK